MNTDRDRKKIKGNKEYRIFTEEFRLEALVLLKSSGKSSMQIEEDPGIMAGLLGKWKARYQGVPQSPTETGLKPSEIEAAKSEIRRLKRELMETTEEREILHLPWRVVPGKIVVNIFSWKSE